MSPTLTATRWRTDGNAPDFTTSFSDGEETVFMTAWPRVLNQNFIDPFSAPSEVLSISRRMMPEEPQDPGKPAPSTDKVKDKKKADPPSSSDPRGAPKKKKPAKKPDPPSAPSAKKPPTVPTPVKKDREKSGNQKKKKLSPEPVDTAPPAKPVAPHPPKIKDINPTPEPVTEPLPSTSGVDEPPTIPPVIGTGSLPPELPPESENNPTTADSGKEDSPEADIITNTIDLLTDNPVDVVIGEQANTEEFRGVFNKVSIFFKDLLSGIFPEKAETTTQDTSTSSYIPVALPPPRNPTVELDPVDSFRAGYISQRDIESAIGRDEWTMCCAATFVYAVQSKYPGLDRDQILEAAGQAANTPLADGSGSCVSDSGYIDSIYQYSQALSENLGLDEYIDTPGQYPTVEAAREAGVELMKVELSGTLKGEPQEHHILQLKDAEIDPVGGTGIEDFWDDGSLKLESVMALNWYPLP